MNDSKRTKISLLTKILLAILALSLAILSLEFAIRAYNYHKASISTPGSVQIANDAYEKEGEYPAKYDPISLMRFSGYLGYTSLENHRGIGYYTNNQGFRYDENIPIKKPKGEFRIFITGGSAAWGFGASQNDTYSSIAEKILEEKFPDIKIRVINAGVGAYLSTHERILILNKISEYDPDIIVMFSGWNDGYAAYRGTRVIDDGWDYMNAGAILANQLSEFAVNNQLNVIQKLDASKYENYKSKILYLIEKALYIHGNDNIKKKEIERINVNPVTVSKDLQKNISTIHDLSKRLGFSLIFYLQPSIYNTSKELSEFEAHLSQNYNKAFDGFPNYHSHIYDLFRKDLPILAEKEGFVFMDSDQAISGETKTVFQDPVHFGDRGNRLIGEHLASALYDEVIKVLNIQTTSTTKTDNH